MASNPSKRSFEALGQPDGRSSSKRVRPDPDPALWDMILNLPPTATQTLLYSICVQNPELSTHVREAHDARLAEEAARPPINFDHYSKDCWYTLNQQYSGLSSSKQYDRIGDICQALGESREAIMKQARPEARFETRRNALEVLRKICKSIALCDEYQIQHELMSDGIEISQFAEAMSELASGMTDEERCRYKEDGLYDKLHELQGLYSDYEPEGLQDLLAIFDGTVESEEGAEDEGAGSEDANTDGHDHYEDTNARLSHLISALPQAPIAQRTKVFSVLELS